MTAYCRRKMCVLPEEAKAETEIFKYNNMEFTLDVFDQSEEQIISALRGLNKVAFLALNEYGESEEETSWRGREEELKAFSLNYPGVLLQLDVYDYRNSEFGEPVREYYKDGKMEIAFPVITYPFCTL